MNVIVVCERSGNVRDAFRANGHNAYSCDLWPSYGSPYHIQKDARELDYNDCDLAICHPPCTHLASSGARWWKDKIEEQKKAIEFVKFLWDLPVKKLVIENPVGCLSSQWMKPNQIIEPFWFGVPATKGTCLWIRNLPLLEPTKLVQPYYSLVHGINARTKHSRSRLRSETLPEIASAMANKWGPYVTP